MSKSLGDVLREMERTNVLTLRVHGFSTDALRVSKDKVACMGALALEEVTETPRGLLPLLAAVLDAADAMRDEAHYAERVFHGHEIIAGWNIDRLMDKRNSYDAARAALAEALKEGR